MPHVCERRDQYEQRHVGRLPGAVHDQRERRQLRNGDAAWIAPTTNTDGTPITGLAGYRIEYGATASDLSQTVTIANPAALGYTIQNLSSGTWYFGIVAYATGGSQSTLSNLVSKTIP